MEHSRATGSKRGVGGGRAQNTVKSDFIAHHGYISDGDRSYWGRLPDGKGRS